MLVVDVIVIIALVLAFATGIARGFFASLGTIAGLVVGAFAALWLVPLTAPFIADVVEAGLWRTLALAGIAIGIVVIAASIGGAIGAALRRGVEKTPLRGVDRFFGGILGVVATGLVLLMVSASVTATGMPVVAPAVAGSRVLTFMDDLTPEPVDTALAQVRGAVLNDGLPRLGDVLGGAMAAPLEPPVALDDPELQAAAASVARISGTAYSCGTSMTGSGFVAAPGLVVTNAHVVAGVDAPFVELPGGEARQGRLVYFDPVDDLAVIAIDGLSAAPLPLVDPVAPGTALAVQGYPLGGPFTSGTAGVVSVGSTPVADIYDSSAALREIYALDANVQPGNSGGPVLTGDGAVAGVVFARGDDGQNRGYAMTTNELRPALDAASAGGAGVSSGRCTT